MVQSAINSGSAWNECVASYLSPTIFHIKEAIVT